MSVFVWLGVLSKGGIVLVMLVELLILAVVA